MNDMICRDCSLSSAFLVLLAWLLLTLVLQACALQPKAQFQPLQQFQDSLSTGGLGPKMVVVPAGEFMMGAPPDEPMSFDTERPVHKVTIRKLFAISQYEITFAEFDRFVDATGHRKPSDKGWGKAHWGRTDTPVFDVSWHDAQNYVKWLSEQTGKRYRLPSEAQWEYAARAGTTTPFSTGNCIHTDQANYHGQYEYGDCPISPGYFGKALPVGSYKPNAWGLYDVHGNIFEWIRDCWHSNYEGAPDDGSAWMNEGDNGDCERRVIRGGSWSGRPLDIRSAYRARNDVNFKSIFIGFRVMRELD